MDVPSARSAKDVMINKARPPRSHACKPFVAAISAGYGGVTIAAGFNALSVRRIHVAASTFKTNDGGASERLPLVTLTLFYIGVCQGRPISDAANNAGPDPNRWVDPLLGHQAARFDTLPRASGVAVVFRPGEPIRNGFMSLLRPSQTASLPHVQDYGWPQQGVLTASSVPGRRSQISRSSTRRESWTSSLPRRPPSQLTHPFCGGSKEAGFM